MSLASWTTGQIVWIAVLILIYVTFVFWYGGRRAPVTEAQAQGFLKRMQVNRDPAVAGAHPEVRGNFERLIAQDDGREFVMVNLETHLPGPEAEAADAAYAKTVLPLLLRRGSFPVFMGKPIGPVLGSFGGGLHRVALVRYRSLYDLLDMNADPAMSKGAARKFAALANTEVFAARPVISAIQVRLTLGLMLLVIGAVGVRLLR